MTTYSVLPQNYCKMKPKTSLQCTMGQYISDWAMLFDFCPMCNDSNRINQKPTVDRKSNLQTQWHQVIGHTHRALTLTQHQCGCTSPGAASPWGWPPSPPELRACSWCPPCHWWSPQWRPPSLPSSPRWPPALSRPEGQVFPGLQHLMTTKWQSASWSSVRRRKNIWKYFKSLHQASLPFLWIRNAGTSPASCFWCEHGGRTGPLSLALTAHHNIS